MYTCDLGTSYDDMSTFKMPSMSSIEKKDDSMITSKKEDSKV